MNPKETSTESSSDSNNTSRTIRAPPFPGRSDPYASTLAGRQNNSNDSDRTIHIPQDSASALDRGLARIRRPRHIFGKFLIPGSIPVLNISSCQDHEQNDRTFLQEQFMRSHNNNVHGDSTGSLFGIYGYQHFEHNFVDQDGRKLKITITHGEPPSYFRGMLEAWLVLLRASRLSETHSN